MPQTELEQCAAVGHAQIELIEERFGLHSGNQKIGPFINIERYAELSKKAREQIVKQSPEVNALCEECEQIGQSYPYIPNKYDFGYTASPIEDRISLQILQYKGQSGSTFYEIRDNCFDRLMN